jgi:hypothetical protein
VPYLLRWQPFAREYVLEGLQDLIKWCRWGRILKPAAYVQVWLMQAFVWMYGTWATRRRLF